MVTYVEAPAGSPLPFGLLSVATVLDGGPDGWMMGTGYQPDYCGESYVTEGACIEPDLGTAEASVDVDALATLDITGNPAGTYTINWGEGDPVEDATPDGATHTYTEVGTFTIVVTGPDGYVAVIPVTVTADEASGPFDGTVGREKVPNDGIGFVEGFPFTVYHSFTCRYPGSGGQQAITERARRAFTGGEGRGVEQALARYLRDHEDATDITPTPGTPVHLAEGVALLEKHAAANYGNVPTLHGARDLGSLLGTHGTVTRQGTRLETVQGTPFASLSVDLAAPGDAEPAGAGEGWLYVTGTVVARRGVVDVIPPAKAPGTNDFLALVERQYALSVECVVAAVLVSTGYAEPAA